MQYSLYYTSIYQSGDRNVIGIMQSKLSCQMHCEIVVITPFARADNGILASNDQALDIINTANGLEMN